MAQRMSQAGLLFLLLCISVGAAQTTLVSTGSVWRFMANGYKQGIGWRGFGFNDTAWPVGPAPLGHGDGDEATVVFNGTNDGPVTVYFRHSFVLTNGLPFQTLTLRLMHDDGAVVYVNSNEVYRVHLPSGPLDHLTAATNLVEGLDENVFQQRGIPAFYLRPGTNIIAVELHQHSDGRADASFDLELIAGISNTYPTVTMTSPVDGEVYNPGTILIRVNASDADGHIGIVHFYAGTNLVQAEKNEIGSRTSPPFDFTWVAPPGRYHVAAVAMDQSGRSTRTPWARIQVGEVAGNGVVRGPYLQSCSSTGIVIRWRTAWPTDSMVHLGTEAGSLGLEFVRLDQTFEHELQINGLQPGMKYFYNVLGEGEVIAGGPDFFFRTAPTNTRPVRIWAIGDSGTAQPAAAAVRDSYAASTDRETDVWLMLGDNAYESGTDAQYQAAVFDLYPKMLRNTVLWPTLGNHDASSNGSTEEFPYLEIFSLPRHGEAGGLASGTERYYSFDHANVHFVCLDAQSSDRRRGGPMLTWLENDLAATEKDWIIAFWHHPPYTFGTHDSDAETELIQMRENAVPILEAYGVDLVLCGHSHVYERSYLLNGHYGYSFNLNGEMILDPGLGRTNVSGPYRKPAGGLGANQGTVYVVCGVSGEGGTFDFTRHPAMAINLSGHGSMVIDVNGLRLDAKFLRDYGDVDDYFSIIKGLPDEDVQPRLATRRVGSQVQVSWPTSLVPYRLEAADSLRQPVNWTLLPGRPDTVGRQHRMLFEPSETNRFFRLHDIEE